jgi:hypothetical protein
MKLLTAALTLLLCFAITPTALASGKKTSKTSITFHIETESSDNPKMIFPYPVGGKQRFFRRLPEISKRDIVSFNPFPSQADEAYGVIFKLKPAAANRLAAITNANQGRWLVAQVNGRMVDAVLIDRQISDGVIVIWQAINLTDIAEFDKEWPRVGTGNAKKKK